MRLGYRTQGAEVLPRALGNTSVHPEAALERGVLFRSQMSLVYSIE